jgi:60 kDa SS-A/Ro ribonucleoprotein
VIVSRDARRRVVAGLAGEAYSDALQEAMEIAIENVPLIDGTVFLCPDVSGSMASPLTGHRAGATSAVRCIDVAALVGEHFCARTRRQKCCVLDESRVMAMWSSSSLTANRGPIRRADAVPK